MKSQSTFSGLQIKCSEVSLTSGSEMGRTYSQNESSTSSHMTMQAREMRRMKSLPSIFRPRSSITHLGLEELPHPERLPQAGERHGCLHPCSHPPCKGVLSASCGAIKYRPHQKEVRQKALSFADQWCPRAETTLHPPSPPDTAYFVPPTH